MEVRGITEISNHQTYQFSAVSGHVCTGVKKLHSTKCSIDQILHILFSLTMHDGTSSHLVLKDHIYLKE